MAWLTRDGEVLATAELAETARDRLRGLFRRPAIEGVLLLARPVVLHTVGVARPVDVAFCDRDLVVLGTIRLAPCRVAMPRAGSRRVLVAEGGAFERWRLVPGDRLEVEGT